MEQLNVVLAVSVQQGDYKVDPDILIEKLERLDEIFAMYLAMYPIDDLAQEGQDIVNRLLEDLQ